MADKKLNTIKIKLVGSLIGCSDKQRKVVRGLGLTKKNHNLNGLKELFKSAV